MSICEITGGPICVRDHGRRDPFMCEVTNGETRLWSQKVWVYRMWDPSLHDITEGGTHPSVSLHKGPVQVRDHRSWDPSMCWFMEGVTCTCLRSQKAGTVRVWVYGRRDPFVYEIMESKTCPCVRSCKEVPVNLLDHGRWDLFMSEIMDCWNHTCVKSWWMDV